MIVGGGIGSSIDGSFSLYLVDNCGSEACFSFIKLKRCGFGVISSTSVSFSSLVAFSRGVESECGTFVVAIILVPGREAGWPSVVASEFLRDISSGSLVMKLWKVPCSEGAKERLNLFKEPIFLCRLSGLLVDRGESEGSTVLNRLLLLALVDGRLRMLLSGILLSVRRA